MEVTTLPGRAIPYGLLPDWAIRRYVGISPFAEGEKRPGVVSYGLSGYGYDVRLGRRFKVFAPGEGLVVDPKRMHGGLFRDSEGDVCVIPANGYLLGETEEEFRIPDDVLAVVVGKSTYARAGVIVNVTPGEPGWVGRWTIEISNSCPIPAVVYAGEGVAQVLFFRGQERPDVTYADKGGKYQNQDGLTLPRVDS